MKTGKSQEPIYYIDYSGAYLHWAFSYLPLFQDLISPGLSVFLWKFQTPYKQYPWKMKEAAACSLALRQAGLPSSFIPSAAYYGSCFFARAMRVPVQLHVISAVQCSCISGSCKERYGTVKKRTQTSRLLVDSFDRSCTLPWRLS